MSGSNRSTHEFVKFFESEACNVVGDGIGVGASCDDDESTVVHAMNKNQNSKKINESVRIVPELIMPIPFPLVVNS